MGQGGTRSIRQEMALTTSNVKMTVMHGQIITGMQAADKVLTVLLACQRVVCRASSCRDVYFIVPYSSMIS